MAPVELFMTDFCPFAQRAWLAFLEKEANPAQPKLFNYREVNYFNPDLPETKEFLALHNTVPAGRHDGKELRESMPIAYYVDETWKNNPLQPASAEGIAHMKDVIAKFTSGKLDVVSTFYKYLFTDEDTPAQEAADLKQQLLTAYSELSKELVASGGPFLLGSQFTLADIALIPFVDRALVLLPHYKGFQVPQTQEYAAFHAWRKAYAQRPSHKISNADRLPRSVAVQPFKATKRDEYIIEMYAGYGNNVRDEARAQLRHAPPGQATVDIAKCKAEKKAKAEALAARVRQNRIVYGVAAGAFLGVVLLKAFQVFRRKQK